MGWYFIRSSPEPKLKIVTKDEGNNESEKDKVKLELLLILICSRLLCRQPAYCQTCCCTPVFCHAVIKHEFI